MQVGSALTIDLETMTMGTEKNDMAGVYCSIVLLELVPGAAEKGLERYYLSGTRQKRGKIAEASKRHWHE